VRERLVRKMFQRIKVAQSINLQSKQINNNVLISKFVFRAEILRSFIGGVLINKDMAKEDTQL